MFLKIENFKIPEVVAGALRQRALIARALFLRQPRRAFRRTKPLYLAPTVPFAPFVAIVPYRKDPVVSRQLLHETWVAEAAWAAEALAAACFGFV